MMDFDNVVGEGARKAHENGFTNGLLTSVENGVASVTLNGFANEIVENNGRTENSDHHTDLNGGQHPEEEKHHTETSVLTDSEEVHVKDVDKPKHSRSQKSQFKSGKPLGGNKDASSTLGKTVKHVKGLETKAAAAAKGSAGLNSQSKQSFKSSSINDRQIRTAKPGKSDTLSVDGDRAKLKPLKKGSQDKPDGHTESSTYYLSPKPQRAGGLPKYGFSFKCDERAEKRREFYSKLEERIHAQEEEKTNLQVKSKESQEAELKMLRKSLNFKATPMPTFYQEPQVLKAELKKIPPTRPKSPKLGRKKTTGSIEDSVQSSHLGRLSLDQKVSNLKPVVAKGTLSLDTKKPQRKSLPRLPSQKTVVANGKNEAAKSVPEKAAASVKAKTERKNPEKDKEAISGSRTTPADEPAMIRSDQDSVPATERFVSQTDAVEESSVSIQEGKT